MQRPMDYAEAAQRLVISIAMIFFFTLLLVAWTHNKAEYFGKLQFHQKS